MSDGQTFTGINKQGTINFKGIPYAQPPTGARRWKAPKLITHYDSLVDGTEDSWKCATFVTGDDPMENEQYQSEDCLHVNIQVPKWVL